VQLQKKIIFFGKKIFKKKSKNSQSNMAVT